MRPKFLASSIGALLLVLSVFAGWYFFPQTYSSKQALPEKAFFETHVGRCSSLGSMVVPVLQLLKPEVSQPLMATHNLYIHYENQLDDPLHIGLYRIQKAGGAVFPVGFLAATRLGVSRLQWFLMRKNSGAQRREDGDFVYYQKNVNEKYSLVFFRKGTLCVVSSHPELLKRSWLKLQNKSATAIPSAEPWLASYRPEYAPGLLKVFLDRSWQLKPIDSHHLRLTIESRETQLAPASDERDDLFHLVPNDALVYASQFVGEHQKMELMNEVFRQDLPQDQSLHEWVASYVVPWVGSRIAAVVHHPQFGRWGLLDNTSLVLQVEHTDAFGMFFEGPLQRQLGPGKLNVQEGYSIYSWELDNHKHVWLLPLKDVLIIAFSQAVIDGYLQTLQRQKDSLEQRGFWEKLPSRGMANQMHLYASVHSFASYLKSIEFPLEEFVEPLAMQTALALVDQKRFSQWVSSFQNMSLTAQSVSQDHSQYDLVWD